MVDNPHGLPPCPLCKGPTELGLSMQGRKIYCKEYWKCGGRLDINKPLRPVVAIAEKGTSSLDSRDASKTVETPPQVCLSSPAEGFPSPGSANYRRMQR